MTNGQYIRSLSDEELADMLNNTVEFEDENEEPMKSIWDVRKQKSVDLHGSHGDILDWLKAEREG